MGAIPESGQTTPSRPGKGLLGWLGRQVCYVRRAVKSDVTARVVYREGQVEEAPHPTQPDLTLRRTIVDEVIKKKKP